MVDRVRSRSRDENDDDDDRGSSSGRSRRDSSDDRGSDSGGRVARRGGSERDSDGGSGRSSSSSRSRGGSFSYQGRSREQVDKRAQMRGKEFDSIIQDGIKTYKIKDGPNTIRILPPTWAKPEHYGYDLYVHYGVGPDRQSYLCLHKMKGEPDPIAEEHAEALRDGDEKYAKELDSKRRCGVYLIDRDNEKDGVQFWAMPWTIDADINKLAVDRRTGEVLNIDDPEDGYDIEFHKSGSKDRTKYDGVAIARRSSPLGSDKWLDWAVEHPIPDQLVYFDYDHIAKAFGGGNYDRGGSTSRDDRDRDDESRDSRARGRDRDDDNDDSARGSSRRDRDGSDSDSRAGNNRRSARGDDDGESEREDQGSSRGGSGRGRSTESVGTRGRRSEPDYTWDSIHGMTGKELEALCESEEALEDVDPDQAESDEDLADWICEELKIKKEPAARKRVQADAGEESPADKLRRLREERNR